ncbi:hypothetical protein [Sulfolobus monocaudavirus SMV4]|uniref:hypothetical protein n=1 Tax=Sulfolobus monocaudavirus SMV4 TaxID=1732178 RepID=UPI000705A546|nr:hypothetical protein AVT99_gp17 [Sulfolobus monocaudavirus SMV4]ALG97041.1 hypothetical protein [Sulfolobus monocaudavirus SMV4]
MTELYLLNLYPGTVTVTVIDKTNGNSQTYTLSEYQYVNITNLISSPSDCLSVRTSHGVLSGQLLPQNGGVATVTITADQGVPVPNAPCYLPPEVLLKQILFNKIAKNMPTYLSDAYQEISSLVSLYKSGSSISTAKLKSILQEIYDCLQNAINFQNQAGVNFEVVSAWCQIYQNLVIICEELSNGTLTASSLQSLRLPSYSCNVAQACAEEYCNNLNNFISSLSSTQSSTSSTSSTTTPSSSTSSSSSSTTPTNTTSSSSTQSSTTQPTPSSSTPSPSTPSSSSSTSSQSNSSTPTIYTV